MLDIMTDLTHIPHDWQELDELLDQLKKILTPWVMWEGSLCMWSIINQKRLLSLLIESSSADFLILGPERKEGVDLCEYFCETGAAPVIWKTEFLCRTLETFDLPLPSNKFLGYAIALDYEEKANIKFIEESESGLRKSNHRISSTNREELKRVLPVLCNVHGTSIESAPPKVTVVICAYNESQSILWAIQSVAVQTFADWELLVIDDGSSDGTADVVRKHQDTRIQIIRFSENRGKAWALNEALRIAKGRYIFELDADDWIPPETLEMFCKEMDHSPMSTGMITSRHHVWFKMARGHFFYQGIAPYIGLHLSMQEGLPPVPRLYRTAVLKDIGGWPTDDPSGGRLYEDISICSRILQKYQIKSIDKPLYHRVIRSDSISHKNDKQFANWYNAWLQ